MAIQLVVADQVYEMELLTDGPPDWQGVKLMLAQPAVVFKVASGAEVTVQGEDSLAGSYRVTQVLSPAAPRTWRVFLEQAAASQAPAPAAPPTEASVPKRDPSQPIYSSDTPSGDKIYVIKVSGLLGSTLVSGVRKSVTEYKVPYARLSQELARITKTGVKVLSIEEVEMLG